MEQSYQPSRLAILVLPNADPYSNGYTASISPCAMAFDRVLSRFDLDVNRARQQSGARK